MMAYCEGKGQLLGETPRRMMDEFGEQYPVAPQGVFAGSYSMMVLQGMFGGAISPNVGLSKIFFMTLVVHSKL